MCPWEREATTFIGDSKALVLSQRRLEILYDLTDRLTRLRDRDDLLEDAMDVCCEMLRFERAAIAVKQPKGNLVDWPVVRNLRGQEGELTVSRTILSRALVQDERVIVNESDQSILDPTVSMVRNNIRSAMCVPLLSGDRNLGVIYGDRVTTGTTYAQDDIDFLAGIARLVTTGLINAQLMEEQKLKIQLENEMGMARQIQTGLFPATLPDRDEVKVAALNHPGFHVSGDYYDVVELDDGRVFFLIADVTGEGVAASLLMANLQAAVRITLPHCTSTGELLTQWNDLICANTDASRFITAIVGILDPSTRALDLGVAGHHMPHIVRPNAPCTNLSAEPEYPLGVIEEVKFESTQIVRNPGPCTLVTYSDGIIEAMSPTVEVYGMLSFNYYGHYITKLVTLIGIDPVSKAKMGTLQKHLFNYMAETDEDGQTIGQARYPVDRAPDFELHENDQMYRTTRMEGAIHLEEHTGMMNREENVDGDVGEEDGGEQVAGVFPQADDDGRGDGLRLTEAMELLTGQGEERGFARGDHPADGDQNAQCADSFDVVKESGRHHFARIRNADRSETG